MYSASLKQFYTYRETLMIWSKGGEIDHRHRNR